MKDIAIYTLTSELHDEESVRRSTEEFLGTLNVSYELKDADYGDYGQHVLDLIYVRTGGTEGIFQRLLPDLQTRSSGPFYLLTSGKSNSLAASMEILSFLRQRGLRGEIIHGDSDYVHNRIVALAQVSQARAALRGCRLGIIGQPSDWLISSSFDREQVKARLGVELLDIPMRELLDVLQVVPDGLPGAEEIERGLRVLVERHHLQGFTIRCFDLLSAVRNTGCLALARLNSEGLVAGCEGDVPAMLSMMIARALTGVSGFQANPARISTQRGEMLFAHCTIPLSMVERYELDTHFESGIGVAIRGYMAEGPVTVFKVSGDLSRHFIEEGQLVRNQAEGDLCRTQQIIRLDDASRMSYFLTEPIGNHHIILPGRHRELLLELVS